MDKQAKIFIAGHRGMVGSARAPPAKPVATKLLTAGRQELDLLDQRAVHAWL